MRGTYFFIFLFFICRILCSQTPFDYATQSYTSEKPIGFVKYNTFTMMYSYNTKYGKNQTIGIKRHRVIGFNNNGSIRFDQLLSASESSGPWQCVPTYDKGMLTLCRTFYCFGTASPFNGYVLSRLSRIDSTGNVVFVFPPSPNNNVISGMTQASATNFIYSTDNKVVRFNGSTGASVTVVYTVQGTISSINTTPLQQIIVATNSVVTLNDTLGNLLVSKPSIGKYSKIKAHKNTFYGLQYSGNVIDKLDSVLNIVNSITTPSNEPVTDFSMYNDSIAVSFYNTGANLSFIKVYPINTFSSPLSFSNNIAMHKIVALHRDSTYSILSAEIRSNQSMGFTRVKSLSALSYTNDIILKRVKTQYFEQTSINSSDFIYQNSVVVQNNSADTVKYIHINHLLNNTYVGYYYCSSAGTGRNFDTIVVLNLLPNDSVEIQLPLLSNSFSGNYSIPPNLCYDISVPNHRIENNILNSSACIIGKPIPPFTDFLFPNPATNRLSISSAIVVEVFTIIDTSGRIILSGKESNTIDISALSSGMYILNYKLNGENFSKKFVKL